MTAQGELQEVHPLKAFGQPRGDSQARVGARYQSEGFQDIRRLGTPANISDDRTRCTDRAATLSGVVRATSARGKQQLKSCPVKHIPIPKAVLLLKRSGAKNSQSLCLGIEALQPDEGLPKCRQ